jgi:TIR domain
MAGGIFVSYRRDDNRYAAGRFYDRLAQHFGTQQIFMDVDNIEPGLDFVKVVNERVGSCDVLVAVIGPGWLDARDSEGRRRLDNPDDFVRIEIEAALARDVRVVPLLVEGAQMPREADLPAPLRSLARRNAITLTHATFGRDADALIAVLEKDVRPKGKGWFGGGGAAVRGGSARPSTSGHPAAKVAVADQTYLQRWPRLGAWLFAFGALPYQLGCVILFDKMNWSVFKEIAGSTVVTGHFAGCAAMVVLFLGVLLGKPRTSRHERLICAIGIIPGVSILALAFCNVFKISFLGAGQHRASGELAAAVIAMAGAIALTISWRRQPRS